MSALGRYIVDAVVLERRSPTELARDHGISRRWIHKLVNRFQQGGYAALEPRSRRAHSFPHQTPSEVQARVLQLRQELVAEGHDAGPETIAHHLLGQVERVPSVATVWRILKRNGLITPQPHKRPKSSFIRFEAKLPNETWQVDATPVAARRWQSGRDLELPRRPFQACRGLQQLPHRQGSRRRASISFSFKKVRFASLASERQRPHLHRQVHRGQGSARVRARAPGHHLQTLDALSPSDRAAM